MSAVIGSNKVLHFALLGTAGCLAGWLLGEGLLWACLPPDKDRKSAPSLAATPQPEPPPKLPTAPPPPPELAERLKAAGAKSGDVQISLGWKNVNDLDLHCTDPSGETIYYGHKKAQSGGELDVDMNATEPRSRTPVENIYWPVGGAPLGKYRVYVKYFANHGDSDPSEYVVSIKNGNSRQEFTGAISRNDDKKLIQEFEVKPPVPVLRLAAPPTVSVYPDGSNHFTVRLARDYFDGPIRLNLTGDVEGLTVGNLDVAADKDNADVVVKADHTARDGKRPLRLIGQGKEARGEVPLTLIVEKLDPPSVWSWWLILVIGLWTVLLTYGLSFALVGGQNHYLGRPLLSAEQARLVTLGALAAGFIAGGLGQALLSLFTLLGIPASIGFVVGWLLLGALVGWGVCFVIPNLNAVRAAIAGAAGALLGALFFQGASWLAGDVAGRLAGAALLGCAVGLMVALVEVTFRKAWLEVTFAPREVAAVNLGPEPVSLGSDRRSCTIPARGAAPIAYRYWFRDGQVMCEDVAAGTAAAVPPGHQRVIGNVSVTVRTAAEADAAPAPPRPLTPAPARVPVVETMPFRPSAPLPPTQPPRPAIESMPFRPTSPPPDARAAERTPFRPASPAVPAPSPTPPANDACPRCGVKALGKPGQRFCIACGEYY
jgi:hypothetical protein